MAGSAQQDTRKCARQPVALGNPDLVYTSLSHSLGQETDRAQMLRGPQIRPVKFGTGVP